MEPNRSPSKYQRVKIGAIKATMARNSESIGDNRLADLDQNHNCSYLGNERSYLAYYLINWPGAKVQYRDNCVQYHCDHLRKLSSKQKIGRCKVHVQPCQKSSLNVETTCSTTIFLIVIVILSLVRGKFI